MVPIALDRDSLRKLWTLRSLSDDDPLVPAIYSGSFVLPNDTIYDTFLRVDGWHKVSNSYIYYTNNSAIIKKNRKNHFQIKYTYS